MAFDVALRHESLDHTFRVRATSAEKTLELVAQHQPGPVNMEISLREEEDGKYAAEVKGK
ncbi:MAG: hypothetical protein AB1641_07360 [Thermodesulfobacteriota bacterium]